jgi:ankyrin repeat protein
LKVLRAGQSRRWIADEIPEILLEKFAFDLALLAQSETVSQQARAHAAMLLSELYTLRTGSADTKVEKSTKWLHFAAELGCQKAAFWYQRVCHANGVIPLPLESTELNRVSDDSLLSAPTSYLIGRIHRLNAAIHRDIHDSISTNQFTSPTRTLDPCLKMVLFNSTQVDTIAPLHLACYLGDTVAVSNLLESYSPNDKSDHGLNAAHYACLGGSAPALEILIERSVDVSGQAFQNITPLHLAIFMPLETIDTVIYLLLKNGASPDISTEEVQWHAHDIVLSGTPLEWAINTRNLPLVKALAPHSAAHTAQCLGLAVELYFWEIAEELSSWCKKLGNTPWRTDPFPHVLVTERPFRHWIAHGRDHFTAIEKTIQICCRESFLANGAKYDTTHLFASVGLAMFDHDLHVIRTLMSSWPDSYHKHHTIDGDTLAVAIERSRHNDAWADILDMFFERHQTEELQECWYENGMSLLEYAIHRDSTVAVRALFRKGVDINHRPLGALHPPINWWTVSRHSSNEMLHLLLENGAHIPTDFYNALTVRKLQGLGIRHTSKWIFILI